MPSTREHIEATLTKDGFSRWLGIELLHTAPGHCIVRLQVRSEMKNGFGVAHGGIAYSLADTALAFASNTYGKVTVSIENSISYPRSVSIGDVVTAEARELHRGSRVAFYDIQVKNQDGVLVAMMRGTVYQTSRDLDVSLTQQGSV